MSAFIQGIGRRSLAYAVGAVMALTMSTAAAENKPKPAAAKPAATKPTAKPAARPAAAKPAQPAGQPVQIELSHQLPPSRAKALEELVERFNAQSNNSQVTLVEGDWKAAKTPHMMILGGADEDAFLSSAQPRYRSLSALMREAGVALQTGRPPAMVTRKPVNATNGQLLALPVGLSTPVLYFNRGAFKRAGINAETASLATWSDLQDVLSKLLASGSKCPLTIVEPSRVLIENMSAWSNVPVIKGKQPAFNGLFHVKYISLMASWHRADLLKIFENRAEGEGRFAKGECAMLIGPSDNWADFRQQDGLDVGLARLPYYLTPDAPGAPQNTLAGGASLWVAAGKKATEYRAVANFVNFWLQPVNQITWQRDTGYLPLNRAGIFASESTLLGDSLENVNLAIKQLTNRPVTPNSGVHPMMERESARRIIDEELAGVWADRKSAKAALDSAVARLSTGK